MVTIEKRARESFELGYSTGKTYETLSKEGIKRHLKTIEGYYAAWEGGFKNHSEYRKYLKDLDFKEIYNSSNGLDGAEEDNPYVLMSRFLDRKDELESEGKGVEEIRGTEEYDKLEEFLPKEGDKRISYLRELKRGLEILNKQGKIKYGNLTSL